MVLICGRQRLRETAALQVSADHRCRERMAELTNLDDCTDRANIEYFSSLPLGADANASVAGGMAGINSVVNPYLGK
jgi:hypothetical protein